MCEETQHQLVKNYRNSNFLCEPIKRLLPASADALCVSQKTYAGFLGVDNLIIGTMCKGFPNVERIFKSVHNAETII